MDGAFHLDPAQAIHVLRHAAHLHQQNDLRGAAAAYRLVIAQHPTVFPDAYMNLGNVLRDQGDADGALAAYRDAVSLCPHHHGALRNLCSAYSGVDNDASVRVGERLLMLDPAAPQSMANFQAALQTAEQYDRADRWAHRFVSAAPQLAMAWSALAFQRYRAGDPAGALPAAQAAVALTPAEPGALAALGVLYQELRQSDAALAMARRAVRAAPHLPNARWNEALVLLDRGDLAAGWEAYETRFAAGAAGRRRHLLELPQWDGYPLNRETQRLLVWREQGVGDEIMWASMYPELPAGTVVECTPRLHSLFARSFPHLDVRPELNGPLPPCTHQIAAGSLARLKRWAMHCFPANQKRYLRPDPERRFSAAPHGPSVGISWRSMRSRKGGVAKGYPRLEEWRDLRDIHTYVSLQYDNDPADDFPRRLWHPDLDLKDDFDGVAALISSLDAVVSVGNTVGALAGALGVPTAMLLLEGDYTMLGSGTYPWAPSVTTFVRRHDEPDWSRVMQDVKAWLRSL